MVSKNLVGIVIRQHTMGIWFRAKTIYLYFFTPIGVQKRVFNLSVSLLRTTSSLLYGFSCLCIPLMWDLSTRFSVNVHYYSEAMWILIFVHGRYLIKRYLSQSFILYQYTNKNTSCLCTYYVTSTPLYIHS